MDQHWIRMQATEDRGVEDLVTEASYAWIGMSWHFQNTISADEIILELVVTKEQQSGSYIPQKA